jgi:hypothetical protein
MHELLLTCLTLVKETKKMPTVKILLITTCVTVVAIAYRLPDLLNAIK